MPKIVLFDLNGTLVKRTKTKVHVRPYAPELLSTLVHMGWEIGIFSSGRSDGVMRSLRALEEKANVNFTHIKHRDHTQPYPMPGNLYHTRKPLKLNGFDLRQTLLIDDSDTKALEEERDNMVVVPTWKSMHRDTILRELRKALMVSLDTTDDVRTLRQDLEDIVNEPKKSRF